MLSKLKTFLKYEKVILLWRQYCVCVSNTFQKNELREIFLLWISQDSATNPLSFFYPWFLHGSVIIDNNTCDTQVAYHDTSCFNDTPPHLHGANYDIHLAYLWDIAWFSIFENTFHRYGFFTPSMAFIASAIYIIIDSKIERQNLTWSFWSIFSYVETIEKVVHSGNGDCPICRSIFFKPTLIQKHSSKWERERDSEKVEEKD